MLRTAERSHTHSHNTTGDTLKAAALRLHQALERMEVAIGAARGRATEGATVKEFKQVREENAALQRRHAELAQENAQLHHTVNRLHGQHAELSAQVDGLIAQLSAILES